MCAPARSFPLSASLSPPTSAHARRFPTPTLSSPMRIFAAHECAALADVSMATKMTVQYNLFGGTILKLGTKKHHDLLLDGIDSLEHVGCFGLTEAGYGNNAVCMETTATFDHGSFVINTPTPLAQKYWITNGAVHAHWAVVFAQLLIGGRNEGIHGFLVRIRDHATMMPMPGVTIHDMGHKMGSNGVDNAKLAFDHVRVPLDALLDANSSVGVDSSHRRSNPLTRSDARTPRLARSPTRSLTDSRASLVLARCPATAPSPQVCPCPGSASCESPISSCRDVSALPA